MAEVSNRLGFGIYRLSALRKSHGRPVCHGESPGSLLVSCSFRDDRTKEDWTHEQHEPQPQTESRTKQHKSMKVLRVRTSAYQQEYGPICWTTFLDLHSSNFISFVQTREYLCAAKSSLYTSANLQPQLHEKMLPGRMTSWTRGAASLQPETFRLPQQLRSFCTVIFIISEKGLERPCCGQGLRRLKMNPGTLQACTFTRNYNWRSDKTTNDVPLLHRSRTAYYDILKVSPGATQSQIKTAYYKQSFIYHPDKNPGNDEATQLFSEISEAYTVLGNITMRKKYDRGILSYLDLQNAGRPSTKTSTGRSTVSPKQQHQHRTRQFSHGGKTMFDFDAFYQAHYGEQLRRERDMRARKQFMQEQQKKNFSRWKKGKMMELTVAMLLTTATILLVNISRT